MKILVAEDNATDRLMLTTLLRRDGHDVDQATDGYEAVTLFQKGRPQLVLLDALMPGIDGLEVARRIKTDVREDFVPVIFLTSLQGADELARCLAAGGDDFLSKPYNPVILRAKISAFERMRQMHATAQEQRDEIRGHHERLLREQDAARQIFDRIAHNGCVDAPNIDYLISPKAIFNGDLLLASRSPAGHMVIFLGDFTGHGLPASIGGIPLAEIFYSMVRKGFGMRDVLREINAKLNEILPVGFFCCGAMARLDFYKAQVELWNGGLPDLYQIAGDGTLHSLASHHLPLGLEPAARFEPETQIRPMAPGDRLLMCTDGVLEARNDRDEMFGSDRLEDALRMGGSATGTLSLVRQVLARHTGETALDDDLSMVEVRMLSPSEITSLPQAQSSLVPAQTAPRDWRLDYRLANETLSTFNPLPLLHQVLLEVPELRPRSGDIFNILSELYANALDHGVLGLPSSVKKSSAGFAEYYRRRSEALAELRSGEIRFRLESQFGSWGGRLTIRVTDSGSGFAHGGHQDCPADAATLHGRGILLLERLCDELHFHGAGNDVEAILRWEVTDGAHG